MIFVNGRIYLKGRPSCLFLTEFEDRTVGYRPSFLHSKLWPEYEAVNLQPLCLVTSGLEVDWVDPFRDHFRRMLLQYCIHDAPCDLLGAVSRSTR